MAYTTTHLAAIEAAIATGELTVTVDGRSVTYRSVSDLLKAKRDIEAGLIAAGTAERPVSQSYVQRVRT